MKNLYKVASLSLVTLLTSCSFFSHSKGYASGKTYEGHSIKYSFKLDDKQKVLDCLDETLRLAEAGTDFKAFEASYNKMNNYYEQVSEARESEDLKYYMYGNEENQKLGLDFYEILTTIINKANKIHYAVFENDFKSSFYGDMTDEEIIDEIGPKYTDEYYEKNNASKALEAEFNNLDENSPSFNADAASIYARFVKNNNEMAQLAGYENFLDYSYKNYYYRPYQHEMTDNFFNYVKNYAYPYFNKLYSTLTDDISSLSKTDLNDVRTFVLKNGFTSNFQLIEDYKDYFGGEFKTIFDDCWYQSNNYYISYEDDAMETAYTSSMNNKPYMFFGKRYEATTIVHEFGHYYDAVINENANLCYDLAETHSQADEMLFINYLRDAKKFSEPAAKVIIDNQVLETCSSIIIATMVNEFEKKAYLDSDLTIADINQYEKEVMQAIPMDDYFDFDYYWRMVAISSPCYYFSYAASAIGALEVGNFAKSDLRGAIDKYNKLINYNKDDADNYLNIYLSAGLTSPFDEVTFKTLFK